MLKSKKQKILSYAKTLGINYVGICDAGFDEKLFAILKKRRENNSECSFTHEDLMLRCSPDLVLKGAKSVVVCLFPYYNECVLPRNISRYSAITDYHKVVLPKLNLIAEYINTHVEKCEYKCFSDTGVSVDRFLAYKAGLGFFGKNNCLINDDLGSFFFIGYIITTCELEQDIPLEKSCFNCGECIKKCPGGALDKDFNFNPQRCVSYITQLKDITDEQTEMLSQQKSVYGCDICQDVCPHNRRLKHTALKEFEENIITELCYDDLIEISNKKFRNQYKNFAFSWRGKDVILKNFVGGTYVKQRKDNG